MPTEMTILRSCLIEQQLSITFNRQWFQEDISALSQMILQKIANHTIKEKIVGADRENIRFAWQHHEFVLNFDYYSQSCWLMGYDPISQKQITSLQSLLEKPNNA